MAFCQIASTLGASLDLTFGRLFCELALKELYDSKSVEVKLARDEIDAAVQAWKAKWYKELENE